MTSELTSRELVCRTLRHEPTPRVPRDLWALPWADQHCPDELAALHCDYPLDITNAPAHRPTPDCVRGAWHDVGTYVDEWGSIFTNICAGIIGEVKDPLITNYTTDLDKLQPPNEWIGAVEGVNEACAKSDRFMLGTPSVNPFERMQWLRGTEELFIDLAEQSVGFFTLRDRVHEWNLAMIESWAKTDVDAISWSDDWGSQLALLIHPDQWRAIFKPMYRDYVDAIHATGKFAFMHSDGHITAIYDDLIEIGVDAINSQLFCMDIEAIGKRHKGKITFWGEIDRQHILPYATEDEVRQAVRRVADALYDGHGGVIAQCEFGAGTNPANVQTIFEEWDRISR